MLRLKAEYRVLDVTSADKRWIPGGKSLEVSLGTRVANNVEFLWQESRGLAEAGLEADGVLGQSFLSRYDYLLDYKSRQLVLDAGDRQATVKSGKRINFSRVAGRMLLPSMNPSDGSMRLILDSAASNVLLWRADGYQVDRPASLIAMNGHREVSLVHMPLLVVGDQVLQRLEAVVAPPPASGAWKTGCFRPLYSSQSMSAIPKLG